MNKQSYVQRSVWWKNQPFPNYNGIADKLFDSTLNTGGYNWTMQAFTLLNYFKLSWCCNSDILVFLQSRSDSLGSCNQYLLFNITNIYRNNLDPKYRLVVRWQLNLEMSIIHNSSRSNDDIWRRIYRSISVKVKTWYQMTANPYLS